MRKQAGAELTGDEEQVQGRDHRFIPVSPAFDDAVVESRNETLL